MTPGVPILLALLAVLLLIGIFSAIHRIRKRAAHGRDRGRGLVEPGDEP
jgi:hypothetical protein